MSKTKDTIEQVDIRDLINPFPSYEATERAGAEAKGDYSLSK